MKGLWESVDQAAPRRPRRLFPFAIGLVGSAAAVEATELSVLLFDIHLPFLFGLGVVMVCAATGGFLPGCFATICSVLLIDHHYDGELPPANVIAIVIFSVTASIGGEVILKLKGRTQAESWRLAQRERFLRDIFHTLPAPVAVLDEAGHLLASNASAAALFGASDRSINGRHIGDLLSMGDTVRVSRSADTPGTRSHDRHVVGNALDGRSLDLSVATAETISGERSFVTLYMRDETARRQAAQQHAVLLSEVEQLGRAVALGQLGGAIAHELNQPLSSAANYAGAARSLLSSGKPNVDVDAALSDALKQIFRASNVLRRLRRFVEAQPPEMEWIDAQQVIEEAVGLGGIAVRTVMGTMSVDIDGEVGAVLVDRVQIQQVLLNLIINASEAVADAEIREIGVSVTASVDGFASIRVRDSGCGVPAEIFPSLFRPFATSKPGGLGVGLSISRTIVEAHGGELWHEPMSVGGASFGFTLRHKATGEYRDVA